MRLYRYTAPEAEWLEAENAVCFLASSETGDVPSLEDGEWTITW